MKKTCYFCFDFGYGCCVRCTGIGRRTRWRSPSRQLWHDGKLWHNNYTGHHLPERRNQGQI